MTAPKPKVRFRRGGDGSSLWTWDCGCGFGGEFWEENFLDVCDDAAHHSRIHSAERIADYLQGLSDNTGDAFTRYQDVADLTSSLAYGSAANLIRKYLT